MFLPLTVSYDYDKRPWKLVQTVEIKPQGNSEGLSGAWPAVTKPDISPIHKIKLRSAKESAHIMQAAQPVVMEGLDLGTCVSNWTLDYLQGNVGEDRKVSREGYDFVLVRTNGCCRLSYTNLTLPKWTSTRRTSST
jgi:hypothetical protein